MKKIEVLDKQFTISVKKNHPARWGYPIAATIALVTGQPYTAVLMGSIGLSDCFQLEITNIPKTRE
jgi:hypothetical protein